MSFSEPVLIIDDDPVFATVAVTVMEALGVSSVLTACDGEQGVDALRKAQKPVGLIILDLNMPKLDGLAFMRAISLTGFTGHVVVSSGESAKIIESAQNMGRMLGINILGALKKPLNVDDVSALLDRCAQSRMGSDADAVSGDVGQVTEDMLIPYYQPQYRASDRHLCGAEALTRIDLGNGRHISPAGFFQEISHSRRATVVALAVVRMVFADMRAWNQRGLDPDVSINLDASVLEDGEIVPALLALAEDYGVSPSSVVLELTETALPKDMSRLLETLTRLGMAGFGLSLDDYGTGGSNFEMLRLCPFTELKIDLSIVQAMEHDPMSAQFAATTSSFAKTLGIRLVAEGVETEQQFDAVRRCGVDTVQGYLLGKPMPAAGFEDILNGAGQMRAAG